MQNFHYEGPCPVRDVIARLGDKWSLLVLFSLQANGTLRFSELQRSLGDISQRMLTVTLRSLERDGIVERRVYAQVPPKVEYRLTERGRSLMPHLDALVKWAREELPGILTARSEGGG